MKKQAHSVTLNQVILTSAALLMTVGGGISAAPVAAADGGYNSAVVNQTHKGNCILHVKFTDTKGKKIANDVDKHFNVGTNYHIATMPIHGYTLMKTTGVKPYGIMSNKDETITFVYTTESKAHARKLDNTGVESPQKTIQHNLSTNHDVATSNSTPTNEGSDSAVGSTTDPSGTTTDTSKVEKPTAIPEATKPAQENQPADSSTTPGEEVTSKPTAMPGESGTTTTTPASQSNTPESEQGAVIKPTPVKPSPLPQTGRQKSALTAIAGILIATMYFGLTKLYKIYKPKLQKHE